MRTSANDIVGPTEAQFRPGGTRTLPYFQHLPPFAPELLVLLAAALVAFQCSRVSPEPERKVRTGRRSQATPELRRSGSSSSVGSTTPSSQGGPKRAGALAKQVHRAYHGGDYPTVLCVWAEVTAQLKAAVCGAPLELPALKLVVKAMLEGSAGLDDKQVEQVATYVEQAGMEASADAGAAGLLQAIAAWQAGHAELAGVESLRRVADRLGPIGCANEDQVSSLCTLAGCFAMHGRSTEVDELLQLEQCPAKVFDEAIAGYLKGPQVLVTKDGCKVRLATAMDVARRLKQKGGSVSTAALTLLFESARDTQVVQLFQEALAWGPLPAAVLEVVARQAFESQNLELGKQVAAHVAGTRASHGASMPLMRLFLVCGEGEKAAALFAELAEQHTVTARTCTLLLKAEAAAPLAFLDQVFAFCRARHYFDVPACRSKTDATETANLYAAAMTAFARVPERVHIAVALDSQLSMLGLDRQDKRPTARVSPTPMYRAPAERSAYTEDIARSDCVVAARRVLQMARGQLPTAPLSSPPGL